MQAAAREFGYEALAAELGLGVQVLSNKLQLDQDAHSLTKAQLVRAIAIMQPVGVIDVLCRMCGGRFVAGEVPAGDLLHDVLNAAATMGDVVRTVQESLHDNHISTRERDKILAVLSAERAQIERIEADVIDAHKRSGAAPQLRSVRQERA